MTILAALICLCSCEKRQAYHWLHDTWSGTYDITMTNNDTGESEPYVATITLMFSDNRSECIVEKGVQGLLAVSRKTYKAYLNKDESIFVLNEGVYDSRILYYGKLASDGKLTLTCYTESDIISEEDMHLAPATRE